MEYKFIIFNYFKKNTRILNLIVTSYRIFVYLRIFIFKDILNLLYFLIGIPKNYCFPSNYLNINNKIIQKNYSYLNRGIEDEENIKKLISRIRNNTMVTYDGLITTYLITKYILKNNIHGVLVETGCHKGGSAAMMAFACINLDIYKDIHLFDSFEGLPFPIKEEYEDWMKQIWNINKKNANGELLSTGALKIDKEHVENLFLSVVKYPKEMTHINVGWFQDTIPKSINTIKKISLLRLDGDLYESTIVCLRNLYPLVTIGGFIIIDDYYLLGCRIACEEYFNEININPFLHYIDSNSRYFIKSNA